MNNSKSKNIYSLLSLIVSATILTTLLYVNKDKFSKTSLKLRIGYRYEGFFINVLNTGEKDIEHLKLRQLIWTVGAPAGSDTVINVGLLPSKMNLDIHFEPYGGCETWDWVDKRMNTSNSSGLIIPYCKNTDGQYSLAYYLPRPLEMEDYKEFYNVKYDEQKHWYEVPAIECSFPDNCPSPTDAVNYPDVFDENNNWSWAPKGDTKK